MRIDRWGRLLERPAFLSAVGPRDRQAWRVLLSFPAAVAAMFCALAVTRLPVAWIDDAYREHVFRRYLSTLKPPWSLNYEAWSRAYYEGLEGSTAYSLVTSAWLGVAGLALLFTIALIFGRGPRTWITSGARFRWRLLLFGLVAYGLVLVPSSLVEYVFMSDVYDYRFPLFQHGASPLLRAGYVAGALAGFYVAAWAEEVVCRGWILQQTAAFTRSLPAILLLNAAAFSALHGNADPGALLVRTLSGVAWSWTALRTGGLELAIGSHMANNLVIAMLQSTFTAEGEDPKVTAAVLALELAHAAAIVLIAEAAMRWAPVRRWTGVTPA